ALERSTDFAVSDDQYALVGKRDAEPRIPDAAELVARVVIKMSTACQRQCDSQFGSAGVMHTGCITQDHAFRHVRQEVLHASCQGLYHLQALHLPHPVKDLLTLEIRQHIELDISERIRPVIAVGAVHVALDTVRDSTEPPLGFLGTGVRQPDKPSRYRHRLSVSLLERVPITRRL